MSRAILPLFLLLTVCHSIEYLSPNLRNLPVNDLFTRNIARTEKQDFWKINQNSWTTLASAYPVKPGVRTVVSFRIVSGEQFMIGCGKDPSDLLSTQHVGQFPNSVALSTLTGKKYKNGQPVDYISPVGYSDTVVTLIIDLRPFESTVSYSIDRSYKGIAYSGIIYWGDVYVMFSLKNVGSKISIDGISFSD